LNDEVSEGAFGAVEGPGVIVEAKDKSAEGFVVVVSHLAVVACFIVEFGAPWGGSTIIDGDGDGRN